MDTKEQRYFDDETTIDLGNLCLNLLKKWRSLLFLGILGLALGFGLNFLPGEEVSGNAPSARSREDAALLEQMSVAAQSRNRYEELNAYIRTSPFMKLDSQSVYTGSVEYYVPQTQDPDRVSAAFRSVLSETAFRQEMCSILGLPTEADLDKMLTFRADIQQEPTIVGEMQVDIRQKVRLTAQVYAPTQDQAQQACDLLCATLETLPKNQAIGEKLELVQISAQVQFGIASDLRIQQNAIRAELNEAHTEYTKLEEAFDQEQFDLYQEYVLTGKTSELPVELFPDNILKKPVILGVVLGFLGCGWYAVAYLLSGKVKTPGQAGETVRRNVLAYVDGSERKKNPIDRWIQNMEKNSFPQAVEASYVSAALQKLGNVCLLRETDEGLDAWVKTLGVKTLGLLSQDSRALQQLNQGDKLVLLVHLEHTTRNALEQEHALCAQYGLDLAGIVVVK